jgi:hypothetical protein
MNAYHHNYHHHYQHHFVTTIIIIIIIIVITTIIIIAIIVIIIIIIFSILGVGDADFASMTALDSDKNMLSTSNGQKAVRDIVQFVSYRGQSESVLAQQVLEEVRTVNICALLSDRLSVMTTVSLIQKSFHLLQMRCC